MRDAGVDSPQLPGGGTVLWYGLGGARLVNFHARLRRLLIRNRIEYPTTVILHLGSNDILKSPMRETRGLAEEALKILRNLLPDSRIVWSDILPRLAYSEEQIPNAGKAVTININKHAHRVCRNLLGGNAHYIRHSRVFNPRFRNIDNPLWRYDGVHLTPHGNLLFRQAISNALEHFNSSPIDEEYVATR